MDSTPALTVFRPDAFRRDCVQLRSFVVQRGHDYGPTDHRAIGMDEVAGDLTGLASRLGPVMADYDERYQAILADAHELAKRLQGAITDAPAEKAPALLQAQRFLAELAVQIEQGQVEGMAYPEDLVRRAEELFAVRPNSATGRLLTRIVELLGESLALEKQARGGLLELIDRAEWLISEDAIPEEITEDAEEAVDEDTAHEQRGENQWASIWDDEDGSEQ